MHVEHGSNDWGHIFFGPVCLFVCLSVVDFHICYEIEASYLACLLNY